MLILTLKLLLAHILGDFVFQTSKMIQMKRITKNGRRYKALLCHIAIHFSLLTLLLFDFKYWAGILIILFSHFLFDLLKLRLEDKKKLNEIVLFFIDQVLHLLIIASVVYLYTPFNLSCQAINSPSNLLLAVSLIAITYVIGVLIKVLMSKWKPEENKNSLMKNAGLYIGMLERLFIFGFILMNYWEGIGFLLAAKSVFRFGDLSRAEDRNLTEYILIGTLLSFGLAILVAVGYNYLLEMI
ncbi:DUF3307 domain-containing protein [Brumimicrobium sp.]|uniref:DUF3307 domain-containing protein n=1 Tax=Brumimicrobium sp. TaxID=2029867 RepID=UPI003A8F7562